MSRMGKIVSACLWVWCCWIGVEAHAQQLGLQTLYNQNNLLINPAAAGLEDCISGFINGRNQWSNINESPRSNVFTVDARFWNKHGLGLEMRSYRAGLLDVFNTKLSYANHQKITEHIDLHAGISVGMIRQSLNAADAIATDYTDEVLLSGNQSDGGFTADMGLMMTTPKWKVGLSIPQVFGTGLSVETADGQNEFKLEEHINLYAQYQLDIDEDWAIYPSALYKNADFTGHQIDLGAKAEWKQMLGVGILYRTAYGISALLDFRFMEKFNLAYSYEFWGDHLTGLSNGSHEIMLGIRICRAEEAQIEEEQE